jgi:dTDP-4-amino-4,6-dideoxygalactose transaminase
MMNPALLDDLVTEKTKAMIAVHMYGQTLPVNEIEDFSRRHGIVLIEDAAQALGSHDGERPAGSMGDISCLSFDPTKVIGSFSSAGALLSDDDETCEKVRALRYHGRDPETRRYEILGYNSQLATEMAAMLNFKLSRLDEWIRQRGDIAKIYLENLSAVLQVSLPEIRPGSDHNWHKFVIRVKDRDLLSLFLKERGVATRVHYPNVLCDEPLVQKLNLPREAVNVPVAREVASSVLSLPIFPELTEAEAVYVVDCIRTFYDEGM